MYCVKQNSAAAKHKQSHTTQTTARFSSSLCLCSSSPSPPGLRSWSKGTGGSQLRSADASCAGRDNSSQPSAGADFAAGAVDLRSLCGHVSAQSPGTELRQSSLDGDVAGPRARLDSPRLDSLHCECEHSRVQLQARAASAEDADASGTRRDPEGIQQLVDSAASGPALAELVLSLARGAARADEKCLFAAPLRAEAAG